MDSTTRPALTLPAAIIIAGAIIAMAIIWVRKPVTAPVATNEAAANSAVAVNKETSMAPVTSSDHIFGNPNAIIKIVEYSDTSCPYCKIFHPTMQKIMEQYGPSGKVAWVYRSFPLDKPNANGQILHPNAGHESQALECASALGGNDAFWKFINRLYEITPSDQGQPLDQKQLPVIAKFAGLDTIGFNECLSSGRFKDKVEKQYLDGVNAGVSGTPYSVIITPSGSKIPIIGAQSYATVKTAIDALLAEVK